MIRPTPRLEIHTDRIAENLHAIVGQCTEHGVQVAAVTKVLGGPSRPPGSTAEHRGVHGCRLPSDQSGTCRSR